MIIRYIGLLALGMSFNIQAAEKVTFELDKVTLTDLVKIAYGDLNKSDFFIDDDLFNNQKKFSINANSLSKENSKQFVNMILDREGYEINRFNKVTTIIKRTNKKIVYPYVYNPKYRSTQYLQESLEPLFETGFKVKSKLAGIDSSQNEVKDTGTSAYSQLQNPSDVLMFQGSSDEIKLLTDLLPSLDTPVPELMITTYIYEVSNGKGNTQALDLTASILGSKLGFKQSAAALGNYISLGFLGINAILNALKTDNRFKVVSSPSLRVRDKENANFTVGSDVPVLGAVVSNNNQSTQSIEYKQSGLILNISPKIKHNQFELKIDQQLSNFVPTSNGVNNSPTLNKRSISTVVNAQDDEVIILGGLEENKQSITSSGFSILPSVLRNNSVENSKNNILIVMHVKKI